MAQECGKCGGEHRLDANRLGGGKVRGQHRERAPREREPRIAVQAAAEELEVVRDRDERSNSYKGEQPEVRAYRYGDADPSNVSPLVRGAEMRVAETRAVNRALRKAYGIGICSVEEIGSFAEPAPSSRESKKVPPQPVNGNYGGPKVRDRLCQLIRQHQLDANLVKSYAVDFCGTKTLREASREQVEGFVTHLADWADKDRNALLCQLNSYLGSKEGAA